MPDSYDSCLGNTLENSTPRSNPHYKQGELEPTRCQVRWGYRRISPGLKRSSVLVLIILCPHYFCVHWDCGLQGTGHLRRGRTTALCGTDGSPSSSLHTASLTDVLSLTPSLPLGPRTVPDAPELQVSLNKLPGTTTLSLPAYSCTSQKPSLHNRKPIALCYQKTFPSQHKTSE